MSLMTHIAAYRIYWGVLLLREIGVPGTGYWIFPLALSFCSVPQKLNSKPSVGSSGHSLKSPAETHHYCQVFQSCFNGTTEYNILFFYFCLLFVIIFIYWKIRMYWMFSVEIVFENVFSFLLIRPGRALAVEAPEDYDSFECGIQRWATSIQA